MLRRLARSFRRAVPEEFPSPTTLVVGLGNPGPKYADTRHNIGFRVIERLAARREGVWRPDRETQSMLCPIEIGDQTVALMAPQTFMNRSGESVEAALERWPALDATSDLLIVYDDLDLPIGRIRLRPNGGAGGHNGIGDILDRIESRAVARLRFGIGRPGGAGNVLDWVLSAFSDEDEEERLPDAIEWAADAVEAVIRDGVTSAMGRYNAERPDAS